MTVAVAACSDPAARVSIVVVGEGACGRPANATGLEITAFATGGEVVRAVSLNGSVDIADFPGDTEQLGVEVIGGGGQVVATGKSAPLAYGALADGAEIPIFMAPPDGFCATGALSTPRVAPLVARAGDGILVVGGIGEGGVPLTTAERYDLATGTFVPVDVPEVLGEGGFVGAALAALPDGRVIVSGGGVPTITIYDPVTHAFGESVLVEGRAFHAAIAVADTRVLLAGGCSERVAGACAGVVRKSSKIYDVDDPGSFEPGPTLEVGRLGATAFDLGIGDNGSRTFVVAGGVAPDGSATADRFGLDADARAVGNMHASAAALDGGALLTAASGAASILAPDAAAATPITAAPELDGTSLVALEDGRVLGFGGTVEGRVTRYDPMTDRWESVAIVGDSPGVLGAPTLLRLDDGSILVLGGATPSTAVYRYRPSLVGPATGALTVVPSGDARQHVLTPVDPSTVTRIPDWTIATTPAGAPGSATFARALVGGPRFATGSIRAVVRVRSGGVALVAQQRGPGEALVAELAPGTPARLVRLADGKRVTLCSGDAVAAFDAAAATTLELEIGDSARVVRDDQTLLACGVTDQIRGAWGLGALGASAAVAVDAVSIAR